jgi:hypothetical protein
MLLLLLLCDMLMVEVLYGLLCISVTCVQHVSSMAVMCGCGVQCAVFAVCIRRAGLLIDCQQWMTAEL